MPFYTRARSPLRHWKPALLGAGVFFLWTVARVVFVLPVPGGGNPGVIARIFYIFGFTAAGGVLAGAFYWALALRPVQDSTLLRSLAGTVLAASFLTGFTIASSYWAPGPPVPRLAQPGFVLSTTLISILFGWLLGRDLLDWAGATERVYLNPAQFAALSVTEQAQLRPEIAAAGEPPPPPARSN